MRTFIEWSDIVVKGSQRGVKKTTCPNCSHTRKKKKDPCLYVNFNSGVAKCFNCDALSFRDSNTEKAEVDYTKPPQHWQNYTTLSDGLVKYCSDRAIRQETLIHFGITEEKQYQPAKQKEVNNIVFNYFEGDKLVRPATITVLHNGVLIQDNWVIEGATRHKRRAKYEPHPDKLPLKLQDHDHPVHYRNVWLRPLD